MKWSVGPMVEQPRRRNLDLELTGQKMLVAVEEPTRIQSGVRKLGLGVVVACIPCIRGRFA